MLFDSPRAMALTYVGAMLALGVFNVNGDDVLLASAFVNSSPTTWRDDEAEEAEEDENSPVGYGVTRQPWGFDTFSPEQHETMFRFKRWQIEKLMDELAFPPVWILKTRGVFTGEEAMLLYLRRMSYPTSLLALTREGFTAQISDLSQLYHMVDDWLYETHTRRLLQTGLTKWAPRVRDYADAICEVTGIHGFNVFGFIDGTTRAIARPGYFQREFYSGHKRVHCLQFLSVTGADGMILYTWGPGNGCHQDNWLLEESQLDTVKIPRLCEMLGDTFCVYGDPIFRQSEYLQKGFERVDIMDWQVVFNKAMNAARVSIEHIFGRVLALWTFLDFHKTHSLFKNTFPAKAYLNGQFLTNCHNCFHYNQTSAQFGVRPPTLHEYLNMEEVA